MVVMCIHIVGAAPTATETTPQSLQTAPGDPQHGGEGEEMQFPGEGGAVPQLQRPRRLWPPRLAPFPARAGPLCRRWSDGDIPAGQSLSLRAVAPSQTLCGSPGTSRAPQGTREGQGCPWGDWDLTAGPCTPPAATGLPTAGTSPQAHPCPWGPRGAPSRSLS